MKKWYYSAKRFIQNAWKFRKELSEYYWFDYVYTLKMLQRSLKIQEEGMRLRGNEVYESRSKKLKKMQRAIQLLENKIEDNYIIRAEKELRKELKYGDMKFSENGDGTLQFVLSEENERYQKDNQEIINYSVALENKEWSELWDILKGTKWKEWSEHDGSDLREWWD